MWRLIKALWWLFTGQLVLLRNYVGINKKEGMASLRFVLNKALEIREKDPRRFEKIAGIVIFPRTTLAEEQLELIELVFGKRFQLTARRRKNLYEGLWGFWSAFIQKNDDGFEIISPIPGMSLEQVLKTAG